MAVGSRETRDSGLVLPVSLQRDAHALGDNWQGSDRRRGFYSSSSLCHRDLRCGSSPVMHLLTVLLPMKSVHGNEVLMGRAMRELAIAQIQQVAASLTRERGRQVGSIYRGVCRAVR